MITPVGMNNSAMNVDRIKAPRRNNAMSDVSFSGLNAQKVQDGAKTVFSQVVKYGKMAKDGIVKFVKSEKFQENFAKFKKAAGDFAKTAFHKAGELVGTIREKIAEKVASKQA